MNAVLLTCYNNLELTKAAVDSALNQDIPVRLHIVNNGSTDGTEQWISDLITFCPNVSAIHYSENLSPCKVANTWLGELLEYHEHLLSIPNDVRIPSNCYSEMLRWPRGFISASDNGHNEPFLRTATAVSENTPFAVMLVRRWAYQAVVAKDGYFMDEGFVHYASDCDLALRIASCGIRGVQLDIPFWHYGSASWRLAPLEEQQAMLRQADRDRDYFERKWGFRVEDARYGQSAADINFRGVPSTDAPQIP